MHIRNSGAPIDIDNSWLFGYIAKCEIRGIEMNRKTRALFEARAKIVKAMAHPTRLFIVDQLAKEESCVAELTEKVGADMSTVSKHLYLLKSAGIIADEKRGSQVYYSLKVPCILNFFSCVESVLKDTAKKHLSLIEK
jgi:ArsR family transcriptional regulator